MSGITQALFMSTASRPDIQVVYRSNAVNAANASTYSFSNQSIGTAFSNRIIAVGVVASSGGTHNSVTVAGNSATKVNYSGAAVNEAASLWVVPLATGTTATIVVSVSATAANCGIAVWTLENASGYSVEAKPNAMNSTNTSASQTFTFSSVTKGDGIIVMSRILSSSVGTYSITGATERFDGTIEAGFAGFFGADGQITATQSNYNVVISTSAASPSTNNTVTRFYLP